MIFLTCYIVGLVTQAWVLAHLIMIAHSPTHTVLIGESQPWIYISEIIAFAILFGLSCWELKEVSGEHLK